ncbi:hypothetical protein RSP797_00160 [Ralstonia solanacearum]|nr:hypothetical protein RSP797_00160 [Ralstonia solanacearum]
MLLALRREGAAQSDSQLDKLVDFLNEGTGDRQIDPRQCLDEALLKGATLVNVNLLSRLGGSMVLELLIKDGALDAEGSHAATLSTPPSSDGDALPVIRTLVATQQMGPKSSAAERCDKLLVSQLQSNDTINAKSLRCVVLVVPKDQVLGYTKANRRTYRGEYSAYEPSPAKAPAVVKVISGESNVTGQMAALLAEPVAR